MKCPLMPDKDYSIQLEKHLNAGDCIKEECAWWVDTHCAIYWVVELLGKMVDKMPHEGQFRR